uniref:NADH-ubiquinone oxidoreductase chain 6 n=1 Tax=Taeniochauliodes attenuatus TaxID=2900206 RepID=A0A8K1WBP8_9NEOP|nr:NADH dehydrogenase subunit 6 [Taeniochauliodes attenuatus]
MNYYMLIAINILMSWNFTQMNHPLAMGLILLIQTILICLISGMMMQTLWFSYILFLIMLGGMLVLFIYMTSLASNEKFSFSINNMLFNMIYIISMLMLIYLMNFNIQFNITSMSNFDMNLYNNMILLQENKLELIKLYNLPTMNLTLMLVNYLFLTLIVTVNITNINYGPLRQIN